MTRIDFYVLPGQGDGARLNFACRLTDKAFGLGQQVYLHATDSTEARQLDDMLWTFRAGSFVPHTLDNHQTPSEPVVVGAGAEPHQADWDVLINLAPQVPEFFSRYRRVAEIVDEHTERRNVGRQRYRFYKERGYQIHTHKIQGR